MFKDIWWSPIDEYGLEHLNLQQGESGIVARSSILNANDGNPFHLEYEIRCDSEWRASEIEINLQNGAKRRIKLYADCAGNWTDETGGSLTKFDGCFDIDISATPFTNTLPIRRANLAVGDVVDISVIYFLIPEMTVQRSFQRYKRLEGEIFRFEEKGLFEGFSANLKIDEDGLVIYYPELFKRIKPKEQGVLDGKQ